MSTVQLQRVDVTFPQTGIDLKGAGAPCGIQASHWEEALGFARGALGPCARDPLKVSNSFFGILQECIATWAAIGSAHLRVTVSFKIHHPKWRRILAGGLAT